jgi:hypothetical protein
MPNPSRAENRQDLQTEVQPERRIMKLELGDFGEVEAGHLHGRNDHIEGFFAGGDSPKSRFLGRLGGLGTRGRAIATLSDVMLE